jgi:hypothetical protein
VVGGSDGRGSSLDTARSPDLYQPSGAYVVQADDLHSICACQTWCAILGLNQSLSVSSGAVADWAGDLQLRAFGEAPTNIA